MRLRAVPLLAAVTLLAAAWAGCFTPVDQIWCDSQRKCLPGFTCTPSGNCVQSTDLGGGAGGASGGGPTGGGGGGGPTGGGAGGGPTGGGVGGGPAGGGAGGGGGTACDNVSCASGCCLPNGACVPPRFQSVMSCGLFGQACTACRGPNAGCVDGVCRTTPDPSDAGTSLVGGPCTAGAQCGDPDIAFCIPETSQGQPTGFVGGYCSQFCAGSTCPAGSECIEVETSSGQATEICLVTCSDSSQCRPGYICDFFGGIGLCLP